MSFDELYLHKHDKCENVKNEEKYTNFLAMKNIIIHAGRFSSIGHIDSKDLCSSMLKVPYIINK